MKSFFKVLPLALSMAFFVGCSDDDDDPVSPNPDVDVLTHNYFDYSQITREEFRQVRFDEANAEIAGTVLEGVSEYEKDTLVGNMNARMYTRVALSDPSKPNTTELYYMTADSNELYINSGFINNLVTAMTPSAMGVTFNLPFKLPDMMLKVGDRKNTSWTGYSQDFKDFEVTNYLGTVVTASGNLSVKFTTGLTSENTINDKKYYSQHLNMLLTFDGTISMDPNTKKTFIALFDLTFTEGQGLTFVKVPYSTMNILSGLDYPIEGLNYRITPNTK